MLMFDQQPFGPVPARRPIMMPPDPQLEELLADPGAAHVELVGPVPMELREPLPGHPRTMWLRLRWLMAFLLLVPTLYSLVTVPLYLFGDDPDGELVRIPRLIGAGILLAILVVAHLWFLRRARRSRDVA
jgi:hypothetical protein